MALDSTFNLLNHTQNYANLLISSDSLIQELSDKLANKPFLLSSSNYPKGLSEHNKKELLIFLKSLDEGSHSNLVIFIPKQSATNLKQSLTYILNITKNSTPNLYSLFYSQGFAIIYPFQINNSCEVILAGGSYSKVSLHIQGAKPIITKRIVSSENKKHIDKDLRLLHEKDWLKTIPNKIHSLFPTIIREVESSTAISYDTTFLPWGTLAELIFQQHFDATQAYKALETVYKTIASKMYSFSPIGDYGLPTDNGYIQRIQRRTSTILNSTYPPNGPVRLIYKASSVNINGLECVTQQELLQELIKNPVWKPVIESKCKQLCHGDLILEDILVNPRNFHEFKLVDPNPSNQSALFDLSKTIMSLWLRYEFIYFNLFEIDSFNLDDQGHIAMNISFKRTDCQEIYDHIGHKFYAFVRSELMPFLDLDLDYLMYQLRMSAALQMLAIPMFHLLHHKKEKALAFIGNGLYHATLAINQYYSHNKQSQVVTR